MMFREISSYDLHNNPAKVNEIMTDNAHKLSNQLYILTEGRRMILDEDTIKALQSLENYLKRVLDKLPKV